MYELSKDRFLELKHHCMQIPEWKKQLDEAVTKNSLHAWTDPTGELATLITDLENKIATVEHTLLDVFGVHRYNYGYYAVTHGIRIPNNLPEYELLREFYWLLDKKL